MMKEGVGEVAPKPQAIILNDGALQVLKVEAEKRAEYRQYKYQHGDWSKGLQGDIVIHGVGVLRQEVRPIFVGLVGEWATCCIINDAIPAANVQVDLLRKKRGDYGIDLTAFGIHLQVKTRQRANYGNLVRVIDECGRRLPMAARAFIFCEYSGDKTCSVLGWQWTKFLKDLPLQDPPNPKYRHKNVCIHDDNLLCVGRLISALRAKRRLAEC